MLESYLSLYLIQTYMIVVQWVYWSIMSNCSIHILKGCGYCPSPHTTNQKQITTSVEFFTTACSLQYGVWVIGTHVGTTGFPFTSTCIWENVMFPTLITSSVKTALNTKKTPFSPFRCTGLWNSAPQQTLGTGYDNPSQNKLLAHDKLLHTRRLEEYTQS